MPAGSVSEQILHTKSRETPYAPTRKDLISDGTLRRQRCISLEDNNLDDLFPERPALAPFPVPFFVLPVKTLWKTV